MDVAGHQCDSTSRRASGISCWMIDLGAHFAQKIHRGALHYKFQRLYFTTLCFTFHHIMSTEALAQGTKQTGPK